MARAPVSPSPAGAIAAQRTIAVVGDLWTLRILRSIFRGLRRHGEFIAETSISRAVLSDRLARLVDHGVLVREAVAGRHPEYRLSERGLDLWPLFLAMWQWETDWGTARDPQSLATDRPRARVLHLGCGHPMRPQLRCTSCRAGVLPFDTRAQFTGAAVRKVAVVEEPSAGEVSLFRRGRDQGRNEGHGLARVVGDRWNAAVVAAAFRGTRQFAQFRQQLGIGTAQLSARLLELQALGLLRARPYAGTRQEYRLTRAGIALFPITLELLRWGNRWLAADGEALVLDHLPCGQTLSAEWCCGHCGGALLRDALRFA